MKLSTVLVCLAPTIALAVEAERIPDVVAPSPSLPNNTPPIPLPAIPTRPQDDSERISLDTQQMINLEALDGVRTQPDTIAAALVTGKNTLSLRTLKSTSDLTKSLRARSEGTLGQTPWIGMAIGLTCTALAAVMLG